MKISIQSSQLHFSILLEAESIQDALSMGEAKERLSSEYYQDTINEKIDFEHNRNEGTLLISINTSTGKNE